MAIKRVVDGFKHIMQREALDVFINRCFTKVGCCSGPVTSTNAAFAYAPVVCIEGYIYSVAAVASGIELPQGAGYSTVASNKARMYAICVNSAGSVKLWGGSAVSAGDTTYIKDVPTSLCAVGLVKISMASTLSWTVGTNAFLSASVTSATVQWWDISMIPQGVILSE